MGRHKDRATHDDTILPNPGAGMPPGKAPALTDGQVGYLLDLLAIDEGENASPGLHVQGLAHALCRIAGRCPHCEGVTGTNDCPACHGDGYVDDFDAALHALQEA